MMGKEKHASLPLNHVSVVTANGHVIDPQESVASYTQSCVGVVLINIGIVVQ